MTMFAGTRNNSMLKAHNSRAHAPPSSCVRTPAPCPARTARPQSAVAVGAAPADLGAGVTGALAVVGSGGIVAATLFSSLWILEKQAVEALEKKVERLNATIKEKDAEVEAASREVAAAKEVRMHVTDLLCYFSSPDHLEA